MYFSFLDIDSSLIKMWTTKGHLLEYISSSWEKIMSRDIDKLKWSVTATKTPRPNAQANKNTNNFQKLKDPIYTITKTKITQETIDAHRQ